MPARTSGISHVHLLVQDVGRAVSFYGNAFGMEVSFTDGDIVFMSTPGGSDSLALHLATSAEDKARAGTDGGYEHFGMYVVDRTELDEAIAAVEAAGGSLVDRGEHAPGVPYAYVRDLDGYIIEI